MAKAKRYVTIQEQQRRAALRRAYPACTIEGTLAVDPQWTDTLEPGEEMPNRGDRISATFRAGWIQGLATWINSEGSSVTFEVGRIEVLAYVERELA